MWNSWADQFQWIEYLKNETIISNNIFFCLRMIKNFEELNEVCIFADVFCCTIALSLSMLMIQVEILVEF